VGHGLVGTIDSQCVLNQIVGADRDEVEVPQERVDQQCRGRHLDHGADLDVTERLSGIVQLQSGACERLECER
jgi:hypothetical protein